MDKLLNEAGKAQSNVITLYHGTKDDEFKPNPFYNNPDNDYGSGLYTTPSLKLAKEWAMSGYTEGLNGYAYEYQVDLSGLKILDLSKIDSLHWIAVLLTHRHIKSSNNLFRKNLKALIEKYGIDVSEYDVIKGYRADDSYYDYARSFTSGSLTKESLDQSLLLGKLGIQYCFKSPESFDRLVYANKHRASDKDRKDYMRRDAEARNNFQRIQANDIGTRTIYDFIK